MLPFVFRIWLAVPLFPTCTLFLCSHFHMLNICPGLTGPTETVITHDVEGFVCKMGGVLNVKGRGTDKKVIHFGKILLPFMEGTQDNS